MRSAVGRRELLAVAAVVVLAGCSGAFLPDAGGNDLAGELGEVDNVTYDQAIDVDPGDGFTEAELDRLVKRTMARIEVVRELEYKRTVEVELFTREEYRQWRAERSTSGTEAAWENQIWRGLFLIGEDRDATAVFDESLGDAVQGFYRPARDSLVIVSDAEQPTVSKSTLVHELVHALQDQQFGLSYGHDTRDAQAAYDTLVEGEAELVTRLYLEERCGEWSCIRPELDADAGEDGPTIADRGVRLALAQPYVEGVGFVADRRAEGGWEAINDLHEDPPQTTAATIYPDRPVDSAPTELSIPDRSADGWERFDHEPVGDTLGAGALYTMLASNGVIEEDDPTEYAHPAVAGWTGDRFVPYRNGEEYGYVWELAWESPAEAEAFADAYRDLLESQGGLARGAADYVIADGPFAGAYRLTVAGDRVRIVNAPDRDALGAVHSR
jgi:hypothetical protein